MKHDEPIVTITYDAENDIQDWEPLFLRIFLGTIAGIGILSIVLLGVMSIWAHAINAQRCEDRGGAFVKSSPRWVCVRELK